MPAESKIIQAVLKGETQKYAILVKQNSAKIFALANSMLKNTEDAEEITQDVFIQAFTSLEKFRGESKFSTYLYRICYNLCVAKLKKSKIDFSIDQIEYSNAEIQDNFYQMQHLEQKKYLEMALEKMNPENAILLTMFYLEEQTYQEIVELTGLTLANVKVKLHRAKATLAQILNKFYLMNTEICINFKD